MYNTTHGGHNAHRSGSSGAKMELVEMTDAQAVSIITTKITTVILSLVCRLQATWPPVFPEMPLASPVKLDSLSRHPRSNKVFPVTVTVGDLSNRPPPYKSTIPSPVLLFMVLPVGKQNCKGWWTCIGAKSIRPQSMLFHYGKSCTATTPVA